MNVKKILVALIVLYSNALYAQTRQKVDITHATVFLSGAELLGNAKVNLPSGESEILFTNVAGNVNQQSLNIGADNGVVIQSATFQNNYLEAQTLSPRAKVLKDSVEKVEASRAGTNNMLSVVNEQIDLISKNKQVSGTNTGLSVAELQKMLDLVKSRLNGLLTEKDKLTATLKKTDESLALLRMQFEEEKRKDFQPGGQLLVKFYAPRATASSISISYVVPNAGWSPSYDLRVENLSAPVKLFYKANVYQNSGVKWDNVKVSLSTGNPNEGAQAPVLNPWYLAFYEPRAYGEGYLNEVNVRAYKTPLLAPQAEAAMDKSMTAGTMNNYVQVDNSGINTTFDIDLPYTIPSDGQSHIIAVKTYELPATYRYYAAPKLDRDAFLQAQLTNWEDLNLIPATTNIFYEGSYVGQGYIDVRNVKDTMTISLGRDKKIVVRRERDKELRSVKTIGSNVRETFVYTITVRNTRKEAVDVTLMDQLPVSNDKDIVIEDTDINGGELEAATGAVKWVLKLKPNETKKINIGFTVKYPKGKTLNL